MKFLAVHEKFGVVIVRRSTVNMLRFERYDWSVESWDEEQMWFDAWRVHGVRWLMRQSVWEKSLEWVWQWLEREEW